MLRTELLEVQRPTFGGPGRVASKCPSVSSPGLGGPDVTPTDPVFRCRRSAPDGSLSAGVPVVEVRDPLRETSLGLAAVHPTTAPVLSDSEAERDALLGLLRERAAAERAASVELRTAVGSSTLPESSWAYSHELVLGPDCDEVYGRFDKSRVRGSIKRAQRDGVTVRAAESEDDVTRTDYDLHVRTRRRLGVPAQPQRFFRLLSGARRRDRARVRSPRARRHLGRRRGGLSSRERPLDLQVRSLG